MQDHSKITTRDTFSTELPYREVVQCRCGEWEENSAQSHVAHVQAATINEAIISIDGLINEVVEEHEGTSSLDEYLGALGDAISRLEDLCVGG